MTIQLKLLLTKKQLTLTRNNSSMSEPSDAVMPGGLSRIRGTVAYDGKDFSGWGMQPDARTVQGVMEEAISTVMRVPRVVVQSAGRTDAGVHARGQVIHFDIPSDRVIDMVDMAYKINALLPQDVSILELEETSTDFDARFSALSRSYVYLIYRGVRNPLLRDWAHRSWLPLDVAAMQAASQQLLGLHDFAAFCKKREGSTTIRTLMRFDWTEQADGMIRVDVQADAFCYSMVRALVGAVLSIGEGKNDADWLVDYLEGKQRRPEVFAAPACGLTFDSVEYPPPSEYATRIKETLRMREEDDGTY